MPEFELLCDNLHLTHELEDTQQLERLKTWCQTEVSTDIQFNGAPADEYKHYLHLAKQYLNLFLGNKYAPMTAIQYAAQHGYDCYLTKLTASADAVNQPDKDGMTALHWAAFKGYVHTVEALLMKGANPVSQNNNLQLPIHSALLMPARKNKQLYAHKQAIVEQLLQRAPASIKHQDINGDSIAHLLAGDDHFTTLLDTAIRTEPTVLSCPNHLKQYPVHIAILNHKINNSQLLLASHPTVSMQLDRDKRVALHYAAAYGHDDILHLCIAHSSDINVRDTYNKTPLILAAEHGNHDAITALLQHQAKTDLVDCEKKTYRDRMTIRQHLKH